MEDLPMPYTSHPDMGDITIPVGFNQHAVFSLEWFPEKHHNDFDTVRESTLFSKKSYWALAPFVGDPLVETLLYRWFAWVSADGRWLGDNHVTMIWKKVL